jgi:Uma2 family endonuclease
MHMAATTKGWTLAQLHSLPDDGNKYELIRGELFVTPPPTDDHETIAARLARVLDRYVEANGLGLVYRPRAVLRFEGSEAEPDLMVRQPQAGRKAKWDGAPTPILVVEILSDSTRRRDRDQKRRYYIDAGVAEYWIVDPENSTIMAVRPGESDVIAHDQLTWSPAGASVPLRVAVAALFA